MKASLRWALVSAAVSVAGWAQAAIFASAPNASGERLTMDCDAQVRQCRIQTVGGKAASDAAAMRFDRRSEFVDMLRGAADMRAGEGNVPDPAVLGSILWTECREDGRSVELVAICPVGGWDSGTIALFLRGLCDRCQFAPFVLATAGAVPVPPALPSQQAATPTATRLRASSTTTAAGTLRTDGVFATDERRTEEGTYYRSYLRFFDGADAFSFSTTGSPEAACKRYVREMPASLAGPRRGRVEQNGAEVVVTVASSSGVPTRFQGRADQERLRLENTVRPGVVNNDTYAFYECPVEAR